jgi:hypothetical protein
MNAISIIAILLSPLIAVMVSIRVQDWKEKRHHRRYIFSTLMSTRHQVISDEIVRALNMVDVAFLNKRAVRRLWKEYLEMLNNEGLNNPLGWEQRSQKRLELIQEMAKAVGYGKKISHLDVTRFYMPVGLVEDRQRSKEIGDELLRVLKESHGIKLVQKGQPEPSEAGPATGPKD